MLNILSKELITEQNEHIKKAAPTSQSDPAFHSTCLTAYIRYIDIKKAITNGI